MQLQPNKDLLHILRILEYSFKAISYAKPYSSAEDFFDANEQMPFNASLTLLAQIGEEGNKLSVELKEQYSDVPWNKIYNMRNRIAHDYAGIDKLVTFETIKQQLPELIYNLIAVVNEQVSNNVFDKNELTLSINSGYYKYIDFTRLVL